MAEYQDRSGFNVGIVGGAGGSEPPDTIPPDTIPSDNKSFSLIILKISS